MSGCCQQSSALASLIQTFLWLNLRCQTAEVITPKIFLRILSGSNSISHQRSTTPCECVLWSVSCFTHCVYQSINLSIYQSINLSYLPNFVSLLRPGRKLDDGEDDIIGSTALAPLVQTYDSIQRGTCCRQAGERLKS